MVLSMLALLANSGPAAAGVTQEAKAMTPAEAAFTVALCAAIAFGVVGLWLWIIGAQERERARERERLRNMPGYQESRDAWARVIQHGVDAALRDASRKHT